MAEPVKGRSVFNAHETPFLPYDSKVLCSRR
jgi:hypothetical protein